MNPHPELFTADDTPWLARVKDEFTVRASARGVCEIGMLRGDGAGAEDGSPLARKARREIAEYLAGRRRAFTVRADLSACTPFIRAVLREAARIPYGETRSYGWLAQKIGRPGAARAVGQAMGRNPVPLVVP